MQVPVHGPGGIGAHGTKHRQRTLRIVTKLHLFSLSQCLPGFFLQKSGLEARERNMILAATGNRYQLDQVEQAMKIQFPDDEKRHHDDTTDKYHNNILGGAVLKKRENNDGDLDALATAQEEEEAEALVSLAIANRTLREARDKQHQVRMSRGYFPQRQSQ